MKINRFFETVLGASPKSTRWSWGAIDDASRRVFLRVWDDSKSLDEANNQILVFNRITWKAKDHHNHGFNERARHLELQEAGYQLFGVLCHHSGSKDRNAGLIRSFDQEWLLQLGQLREMSDGNVFATIEAHVAVSALQTPREVTLLHDLRVIDTESVDRTTREALVQARLGQGQFRASLINKYSQRCAVTGFAKLELLRASHIKPWAKATNEERLDSENGILLTPSLDALFDRGFITFKSDGKVKFSAQLKATDFECLGPIKSLSTKPTSKQAEYLKYHAAHVYLGDE